MSITLNILYDIIRVYIDKMSYYNINKFSNIWIKLQMYFIKKLKYIYHKLK